MEAVLGFDIFDKFDEYTCIFWVADFSKGFWGTQKNLKIHSGAPVVQFCKQSTTKLVIQLLMVLDWSYTFGPKSSPSCFGVLILAHIWSSHHLKSWLLRWVHVQYTLTQWWSIQGWMYCKFSMITKNNLYAQQIHSYL